MKKHQKLQKKNGIKTFSDLKQANFKDNFFCTITLWNSLEHLPDPIKTLKELKRILKKEGDLIIEIPNIDSFAFKLFKDKWRGLDIPRHLYHFSFSTIKKICSKLKFKIIKIKYNSRSSQFINPLKIKNRFIKPVFILPVFILNKLKLGDSFIIHLKNIK